MTVASFARTACELNAYYPGDPGVLAALLMNRITLQPGDALFMPPGNLHAYLQRRRGGDHGQLRQCDAGRPDTEVRQR